MKKEVAVCDICGDTANGMALPYYVRALSNTNEKRTVVVRLAARAFNEPMGATEDADLCKIHWAECLREYLKIAQV